ncbi:MAG: SIS domain-containing protein [Rhodobacteraceae bacterium]|nr:SIS domain-containing protein [Paracoccaceae bacterium]
MKAQQRSRLRQEILGIGDAVERQLTLDDQPIRAAASALREINPPYIATIARGSSDHVATYLKYAFELAMGMPVATIGPSLASIYGSKLHLAGSVCIAISQSGQSGDILQLARTASDSGALLLAITNDPDSELASLSDQVLATNAGPERSVAATKTFVTAALIGLRVLAHANQDTDLINATHSLPGRLEAAARVDWPELLDVAALASSMIALGRGLTFGISNELALKLKEVCQLHAESYSAAEFLHGPVAIIEAGFPAIALAIGDSSEDTVVEVADHLADLGANVFATSAKARKAKTLPVIPTRHQMTDPLSQATTCYAVVERIACHIGSDPDRPRHLNKVTLTR